VALPKLDAEREVLHVRGWYHCGWVFDNNHDAPDVLVKFESDIVPLLGLLEVVRKSWKCRVGGGTGETEKEHDVAWFAVPDLGTGMRHAT
jgi:hypothetical protein